MKTYLPEELVTLVKEILTEKGFDSSLMEEPYFREELNHFYAEHKNITKNIVKDWLNVIWYNAIDQGRICFKKYDNRYKEQSQEAAQNIRSFEKDKEYNTCEKIVKSTFWKRFLQSKYFKLVLIISCICISCQPKSQPKEIAQEFLNCLTIQDYYTMCKYYPNYPNLHYTINPDTFYIRNCVCIDSDNVKVYATCEKQINNKKKKFNIILFLKPYNPKDISQGYFIYDSKGLYVIENDSAYMDAHWNGGIHDNSTDQQIAKAIKNSLFRIAIERLQKQQEGN